MGIVCLGTPCMGVFELKKGAHESQLQSWLGADLEGLAKDLQGEFLDLDHDLDVFQSLF